MYYLQNKWNITPPRPHLSVKRLYHAIVPQFHAAVLRVVFYGVDGYPITTLLQLQLNPPPPFACSVPFTSSLIVPFLQSTAAGTG